MAKLAFAQLVVGAEGPGQDRVRVLDLGARLAIIVADGAGGMGGGAEAAELAVRVVEEKLPGAPTWPGLATRFLCQALLEEARGEPVAGGWAALHAAWTCDDAEMEARTREARAHAIRLFEAATAAGKKIARDEGSEDLVRIDTLRRVGRFDDALELLERVLAKEPQDLADVFAFERELNARQDTLRHTLTEVRGDPRATRARTRRS